MAWQWDARTKRYRDTTSGRYLSPAKMTVLRDRFLDAQGEKARGAAARLATGTRTVTEWQQDLRKCVKQTFVDQYVLARGGRRQMTPRDWGALGQMLREQYGYLNGFAAEVASGALTQAQIASRGELYLNSSRQAFEKGQAASWGVRLSLVPADGRAECRSNCKCSLKYEQAETPGIVNVYWVRSAAESCPTCVLMSANWNPLRVAASA